MDLEELNRQRMELQARLNLEDDLRMILNSQRGNNMGSVAHLRGSPLRGGNLAMQSLPQNAFVLDSTQTGPGSAFQAIHNGQLGMGFQAMSQRMPFPSSHDSSPLLVINAADLSRLLNPVVTSAPPIIILPSGSLPLQGSGQQFPQQFLMQRGGFAHPQNFGQHSFHPGMRQVMLAPEGSVIPEEAKSSQTAWRQQEQRQAQQGATPRNPLELLAAASPFPNSLQANLPNIADAALAYASSVIPPSTADSYREERSSNTDNPKPKRPLSAYNIFFRDERAKIIAGELSDEEKVLLQRGCLFEDRHTSSGIKESRRKQPHRKAGFQELARIIAARWKRIDPVRLQTYEKMSALGRIKYSRDLQIWAQRERKDVMKPIQRLAERNMEKVAKVNREYR